MIKYINELLSSHEQYGYYWSVILSNSFTDSEMATENPNTINSYLERKKKEINSFMSFLKDIVSQKSKIGN